MTDFLQISTQALPTDYEVTNYGTADIPAYMVVMADTNNAISVNNVQDGIGALVAATSTSVPIGVAMETIPGTNTTGGGSGGPAGYGTVRGMGIAKCVATAAVAAGVPVMVDATGNGTVITQTTGKPQVGISLTQAIASGDEIAVLVSIANNA